MKIPTLVLFSILMTGFAVAAMTPEQNQKAKDLKAQVNFLMAQFWYDFSSASYANASMNADKNQIDALGDQLKSNGVNWVSLDWLHPPSRVNWQQLGI